MYLAYFLKMDIVDIVSSSALVTFKSGEINK